MQKLLALLIVFVVALTQFITPSLASVPVCFYYLSNMTTGGTHLIRWEDGAQDDLGEALDFAYDSSDGLYIARSASDGGYVIYDANDQPLFTSPNMLQGMSAMYGTLLWTDSVLENFVWKNQVYRYQTDTGIIEAYEGIEGTQPLMTASGTLRLQDSALWLDEEILVDSQGFGISSFDLTNNGEMLAYTLNDNLLVQWQDSLFNLTPDYVRVTYASWYNDRNILISGLDYTNPLDTYYGIWMMSLPERELRFLRAQEEPMLKPLHCQSSV